MNPHKALGTDSWAVLELRLLSPQLLQGLAGFCSKAEVEGRWPPVLCSTIVALVPKEGARTEAELRPIGLTPIVYRVWMCARKRFIRPWTQRLYGERMVSPTDHAWHTRAEQEFARRKKRFIGVVYLDCSKCYV